MSDLAPNPKQATVVANIAKPGSKASIGSLVPKIMSPYTKDIESNAPSMPNAVPGPAKVLRRSLTRTGPFGDMNDGTRRPSVTFKALLIRAKE